MVVKTYKHIDKNRDSPFAVKIILKTKLYSKHDPIEDLRNEI